MTLHNKNISYQLSYMYVTRQISWLRQITHVHTEQGKVSPA